MRLLTSILLLAALAVAGCDSVSERVQERFGAVAPKTRDYAGGEGALRAAVVLTFKRLDFTVNRTSDNVGEIEASSGIRHSDALGDSRQLIAKVRLHEFGPGQTEVEMVLSEQVEDASPGGRGEQTLREHGFYGSFFDTLQHVLSEQTGAR
jgi:hypothetical protein